MFKILLVDDEDIIRNGLKTIIEWEDYGFTICGEANSGKDGLDKISSLKPDLVIMDVRMPGMNGLQMMEEIQMREIKCKFIILTGYSEFSYAKKAVELGASSYLLKPIDEDELIERIKKVYDVIASEIKQLDYYHESVSMSRDKAIEKLIVEDPVRDETVKRINDIYGLGLPWKTYQIVLVGISSKDICHQTLLKDVRLLIEESIDRSNCGCVFDIFGHFGVLIKNIEFSGNSSLQLKMLQKKINEVVGIKINIAVGRCVRTISDILRTYNEALMLINNEFVYGTNSISFCSDIHVIQNGGKEDLNAEWDSTTQELYVAVAIGNANTVNELLERVRSSVFNPIYGVEEIKTLYFRMFATIVRKLTDDAVLLDSDKVGNSILENIYGKSNLYELHVYMLQQLTGIANGIRNEQSTDKMKRILNYVDRNYNKDITLKILAKVFNYNSSYLGKAFLSQTGECFNTYINRLRVEKSKKFLKEGMRVYEVAELVGYSNADYYHANFKKYTGVSPSEYKER